MSYIQDRLDAYRHPEGVLPGVRSIIVLALPYEAAANSSVAPAPPELWDSVPADRGHNPGGGDGLQHGRIARYAWSGVDYHDTIHQKLTQLCKQVGDGAPGSRSRGVVDTAPLMERELAQLAGFGWRGKNTLLLNKQFGSYFFLCCLLTDVQLPISAPHESAHCGTCTACLDACPTDAFPQAGVLDASRCVSYLTIEHRGPIPIELRAGVGDWLFGCDVCQEVCPWNHKRSRSTKRADDSMDSIDLYQLFDLTDDQFRRRFRRTPLWRSKRRGILRNAAIVLGNQARPRHLTTLNKGLWDAEPIVRGASAWAIGQIASATSIEMLQRRLPLEGDELVRQEIHQAMDWLSR